MKRHILVVLCDQLRPDFLPVYGGSAFAAPSVERLAAAGTVFDRAISCCPVCAPARAGMMTGYYPSRSGVWTNDVPFRDDVEYLPQRMNRLGYRTACFGKMHHFPADDLKGFQHGRQMEERRLGEHEPYLKWLHSRRPDLAGDGNIWHCSRSGFQLDDELHYEHWIASEAIDYIGAHAGDPSHPLFLWVSFQGPHTPYNPPQGVKGSVDPDKLPEPLEHIEGAQCPVHRYRASWNPPSPDREELMRQRVAYAESIVNIDRQIGRILGALEERGLLDDTTMLLSSDHGDLLGDFGQLEKGPFAYGSQLEVPLILANCPGVPRGERSSVLTGNIDIPGTVLDVAGSDEGIGLSRSLRQLLPSNSPLRRTLNYAECAGTMKLIENERYRFATYPFTGFRELYDRKKDPHDQHNLAGKPDLRDVELEMMQAVVEHMVICDDVQIGGFDLTPDIQASLRKLHPRFDRPGEFKAAFPLMKRAKHALKKAGLDPNYTNWYRRHEILAHYGLDFEEM